MVWTVAAVLATLALAALLMALRERRTEQLRAGFGPEYARILTTFDEPRPADRLAIRRLQSSERDRFVARWRHALGHFIDEPAPAVAEAEHLVHDVLAARGYPVGVDFERHAAEVSVDHPHVVENYRAALDITSREDPGPDDLRQAMVHYRALVRELLAS